MCQHHEPDWIDDGLELFDDKNELFDDEHKQIDCFRGMCSNDAVDSSQPVPIAEPNPKKRKATAKDEVSDNTNERAKDVSINVATSVHSALH